MSKNEMKDEKLQRWLVILETLDEGHGVSMKMLSEDDLRALIKYYGRDSLYLCLMGGNVAVRRV